jgi:hypothetical protein
MRIRGNPITSHYPEWGGRSKGCWVQLQLPFALGDAIIVVAIFVAGYAMVWLRLVHAFH